MYALLVSGRRRRAATAVVAAVSVVPFVVGGCASKAAPTGASVLSWRLFGEPDQVATVPNPKPDLEDDGVPAQTPPPMRVRQASDDPAQPWSRNYGRFDGLGDASLPAPGSENPTSDGSPSGPLLASSSDE